jgi:hypothetical protein
MIKIYLSGPISGKSKEEYMQDFAEEEEYLNDRGYSVVNPTKIRAPNTDASGRVLIDFDSNIFFQDSLWNYYMRKGLVELCECQTIYMLEGWQDSKGARLEYHVAKEFGMSVYYESDRKSINNYYVK